MLLMILEPLIMNNQNLEMSIKKKVVSELAPIIMDQVLPDETNKFD
jgi:hypothetical protein